MAGPDQKGTEKQPIQGKKRIPAYSDQSLLTEFVEHFVSLKGREIKQDFKNFALTDPSAETSNIYLSKLTGVNGGQSLIEQVPKSIIADLKPYLRLFIVQGMGKNYKQVELPFSNFDNFKDITSSRQGSAVGLRSFSYDYLGTHPGDIDYFINCNLKLYFESPDALFKKYGDRKTGQVSFSDLISRPLGKARIDPNPPKGGDKRSSHLQYDQKNHRIKVDIGYTPISRSRLAEAYSSIGFDGITARRKTQEFLDALSASRIVFFLTLKKHTFVPNFDTSDISFELDIEYNGSVEHAFLAQPSNILIREDTPEQEQERRKIEDSITEALANIGQLKHVDPSVTESIIAALKDPENLKTSGEYRGIDINSKSINSGDAATMVLGNIQNEIAQNALATEGPPQLPSFSGDPAVIQATTRYLNNINKLKEFNDGVKDLASEKSFKSLLDAYSRILRKLDEGDKIYNIPIDKKKYVQWACKNDDFRRDKGELTEASVKILKRKARDGDEEARKKLEDFEERRNSLLESRDLFESEVLKSGLKIVKSSKDFIGRRLKKVKKGIAKVERDREKGVDEREQAKYVKSLFDPGKNSAKKGNRQKHILYWFYFGDLVDVVMDVITNEKISKELDLEFWTAKNKDGVLKVIMGDVDFIHPQTQRRVSINLAKIPISFEMWQEFWKTFVVRRAKQKYYFKAFLRDILVQVVQQALTNKNKVPGQPMVKLRPAIDFFALPASKSIELFQNREAINDRSYYAVSKNKVADKISDINVSDNITKGEEQIMFIYDSSQDSGFMNGKKKDDNKKGIYHIIIGEENSTITSIQFNKVDQPFFMEAKVEEDGYLKANKHLSEPYHCDFGMYGNTLIRPGRHIYIRFPLSWFGDPSQEGSRAMALGLGGYFLITKVTNQINIMPGSGRLDWNTNATCKWENFGRETKAPKNIDEKLTTTPGDL